MTLNLSSAFGIPFSRNVSRVKLMDSKRLARKVIGSPNLPKGPVLFVPIDAPLVGLSAHFGVTCIDGCDMLFFDVQAGGKYFCNVASAGDPLVAAAIKYCGETGVLPVWLQTPDGPCGLGRYPFRFNDVYKQAFAGGTRKDYLSDFQSRFNQILEPGVVEAVVASRTGLAFEQVQVGFLATLHTQPALEPIH